MNHQVSFLSHYRLTRGPFLRFLLSPMSVVAIIFIVYFSIASGGDFGIPLADLNRVGALSVSDFHRGALGLAAGILHLFTSLFLHATRLHLVLDLILFVVAATELMHEASGAQALGAFLLTGLIGNIAFLVLSPPGGMILGSSGGVCGLLGCLMSLLVLKQWKRSPDASWTRLGLAIVLAGFLTFGTMTPVGGVATAAHIGGLVSGLTIGVLIGHRQR